jgi:hypothetical protein
VATGEVDLLVDALDVGATVAIYEEAEALEVVVNRITVAGDEDDRVIWADVASGLEVLDVVAAATATTTALEAAERVSDLSILDLSQFRQS